jgi:hypothetical protein
MVLPDRIELSTSPLPMECSTTELRQHAGNGNQPEKAVQAGRSLPQGVRPRKRGRRRGPIIMNESHGGGLSAGFHRGRIGLIASAAQAHMLGSWRYLLIKLQSSGYPVRPLRLPDVQEAGDRPLLAMTDEPTERPNDREIARQNRLRNALRENLKRRKSQLRGRADQPVSTNDTPSDPHAGQIDPDDHS